MTIEQQASALLTELLTNGNKARVIGAKIGKTAQWVGHHRSDSKFHKPMEPEIAQKILDIYCPTFSKVPASQYQAISDNARKVLQELLARGYSPADLAERFDSRPIAITTYADDNHWRGVPWILAIKILEIDLDAMEPPKEVKHQPTTLF